jgi:hypothetical protein
MIPNARNSYRTPRNTHYLKEIERLSLNPLKINTNGTKS